jgi:hypothetical protein
MAFEHDVEKKGEVLDKYTVSEHIKLDCYYKFNAMNSRIPKVSVPSKKRLPQLSVL